MWRWGDEWDGFGDGDRRRGWQADRRRSGFCAGRGDGDAGGWVTSGAKPDAIGDHRNPADRGCDEDHADGWLDDQRASEFCDEQGNADGDECRI